MNKIYRKVLLKYFDSKISDIFPACVVDRRPIIPNGWRAYRIQLSKNISAFVILNIFGNEDRFTLEIAAAKGDLPPRSLCNGPSDEIGVDGAYFRIHKFWAKDGKDHWWWIGPEPSLADRYNLAFHPMTPNAEQADRFVIAAVDSAIAAIKLHVCPYFKSIQS